MSVSATVFALLLFGGPGLAHSSVADVRDCSPLPGAGAGWLAATDGGVAVLGPEGNLDRVLTSLDGLAGTRSHTLLVEGDTVWVGGESGLSRLRLGEASSIVEQTWPLNAGITALHRRSAADGGQLLAGTWGAGVVEVRDSTLHPLEGVDVPVRNRRITSIVGRGAQLWVGSAGGGLRRLGESRPLTGEPVIWSLALVNETLWVGGLSGASPSGESPRHSADARALAQVDGEVWLATYGHGVVSVDGTRRGPEALQTARALGSSSDRVCAGGREGVWIRSDGTDWRRAAVRGPAAAAHVGLPANDISAMAYDPAHKRLWVGTFDDGLAQFVQERWHPVSGPDTHVNVLLVDPSGSGAIWVGTARGLDRIAADGSGRIHYGLKQGLPANHVLSLAAEADGSIVVGTVRGAARIQDGELNPLGRRARTWAVWSIVPGALTGELWLGTTVGLIHWQPNGHWSHKSTLSGHLPDNWVTALARDDETLFVGTYAAGLVRLRPQGGRLASEQLGGGRINPGGLSLADGELWISTMHGAFRYALDKPGSRLERMREVAPGADVTAVVSTPEARWFASRRGLGRHPHGG